MRPSVLIVEPRRDIAAALEGVVNGANYVAVVRTHMEQLSDLTATPAAIIVRISFESMSEPAHALIARLPAGRPPVIAIVSKAEEVAEAERLRCDVVLKAPREINRLCDVLERLVHP